MSFDSPYSSNNPPNLKENQIRNRKKAWNKGLELEWISSIMGLGEKEATRLKEDILLFIGDEENYLGEGGVGTVFRLGRGSGICIKIIANRHNSANASMMNLGNDVDEEVQFLIDLEDVEVEGVSSTRYISYFRGSDYNAIIMEELDAVNLQDILLGNAKFPKNFDLETAFAALEKYIDHIQMEKGIVHNDLEARNIMIDNNTGFFKVIDFGRAFYEKNNQRMEKAGRTDWDNLDQIYEKLSKMLDKN